MTRTESPRSQLIADAKRALTVSPRAAIAIAEQLLRRSPADDEAWLDARLARHQELLVALGMDDDDDDVAEPASPDDLLQRFINDDFDPSEIDPEYKPSKK